MNSSTLNEEQLVTKRVEKVSQGLVKRPVGQEGPGLAGGRGGGAGALGWGGQRDSARFVDVVGMVTG